MNIRDILQGVVAKASGSPLGDIHIEKPKNGQADYAVGVFALAKKEGKAPNDVASELAEKIMANKPNELEKVEASGGYVNFFFTQEHVQKLLTKISAEEHFGRNDSLKDKTVMVEYTDPNPFKLFHIGHLMSNTIGESIARLSIAFDAVLKELVPSNIESEARLDGSPRGTNTRTTLPWSAKSSARWGTCPRVSTSTTAG